MKELLIRWFQFGAFCPLFRLHGDRKPETIDETCGRTGAPNEVWHYGDEAYESITAIMALRESLRPYVSELMEVASRTGVPALRPLFVEFPEQLANLEKQPRDVVDGAYMFGHKYLVSPVTAFNVSSWRVYLPQLPATAERVYHFEPSTRYAGGALIEMDVSDLDAFPLFVRSDVRSVVV